MSMTRDDPFFILFVSRSGSTYLSNLLAHHPSIAVAPESHFIPHLFESKQFTDPIEAKQIGPIVDDLLKENKFRDWKFSRSELTQKLRQQAPHSKSELIREILLIYCRRDFDDFDVYGLKKGGKYYSVLNQISNLLPQSRFIHIVRDGRAVFNSKMKTLHSETKEPLGTDPIREALDWKHRLEAFTRFATNNPDCTLEIQYESLIRNPEKTLEKVFTFLDVPAGKFDYASIRDPNEKYFVPARWDKFHHNISNEPKTNRISAWKEELTYDEIALFELAAGDTLRSKSYPMINRNLPFPKRIMGILKKHLLDNLSRSIRV